MDFKNEFHDKGFGFLINMGADEKNCGVTAVYSNLTRDNIRKAVRGGKVKTERYILLYLYDPDKEKDGLSADFLGEYGAAINNRLKSDIPMFTVYTEEIFKKWSGSLTDSGKETLSKQFEFSEKAPPKYELMRKLAEDYKVSDRLPALVVIDGSGKDGYAERFTSVSFRSAAFGRQVFEKVKKILDAIDSAPNDFDAVKDACEGRTDHGTLSLAEYYEQDDPKSFYNFLNSRLKKKDHSVEECAINIGIAKNTLTDVMYGKHRVKTENLFALAFHLGLKAEELDMIFCEYSNASPSLIKECKSGKNKRYNAILRFLKEGTGEDEINEKLDKAGFEVIKPLEIPSKIIE